MHVPRRRCVGCGRVASKPELVRLAAVSAGNENRLTAVLDTPGTLPGRGAYVCNDVRHSGPNQDCLKLATRRGVLQRAFRHAVDIPAELVESHTKVARPDTSPASRAPRYLIDL